MTTATSFAAWQRRLEQLWADGIPLAGAMAVKIRRLDEHHLELEAPLGPNRNHMGTAFGGSLQGVATLAGWGVTLVAAGDEGARHVVIRDARMQFTAPVSGAIQAEASMPSAAAIAAFRSALLERGRARLTVPVAIRGPGNTVAARFVGEFVAFESQSSQAADRE
jgi:thioesterase domain-containing protein